MYKLLLIEPALYNSDGKGLVKHKVLFAPGVIFPLLAALLPKNWLVETIYESVENVDFETDADLIGLNAMGHSIFRAIDIAREFKKRGKSIFIGGYMASMNPDIALATFDSVIIGDAEISFPLLLNDFTSKRKLQKKYFNPIQHIKGLPIPKYELLLDKPIGRILPVQASRGCQHQCTFCSIASVCKGRYLKRNVDEVIRDILEIKKLGFKRFLLVDDNLLSDTAFLNDFLAKVKTLRMKWAGQCTITLARNPALLQKVADSGCEVLSIGLESVNQEGLKHINKQWMNVKDNSMLIHRFYQVGIIPKIQFMLGLDNDTVESIKDTYHFIMQNKLPMVRIYIMTPIPGTQLYQQLNDESRLIHHNYIKYDSMTCVHYPKNMSPETLDHMYWWIIGQLLSFRSILARTLFNWHIMKRPVIWLIAIWINLQYKKYFEQKKMPILM